MLQLCHGDILGYRVRGLELVAMQLSMVDDCLNDSCKIWTKLCACLSSMARCPRAFRNVTLVRSFIVSPKGEATWKESRGNGS